MSIVVTELTTAFDNTDLSTYATVSIAPAGSTLLLAWVASDAGPGTPNSPTLTGSGLTWVPIGTAVVVGFPPKLTLHRAMGPSPSVGAVSIDFAGQVQVHAAWSIIQISNVDTGGTNGSGAVVQVVSDQTSATVSAFSITLGAFSDGGNGTVGGFAEASGGVSFTPGSGFTLINSAVTTDSGMALGTEYRVDNDTSVDMSSNLAQSWFGIAVEIKAAPGVGQSIIGSAVPPLVWATRVRP